MSKTIHEESQPELEKGDETLVKERRLLSHFFPDEVPPIPTDEERTWFPEKTCNVFRKISFWWLNPVLKTGYMRTLRDEDLFKLTPEITTDAMAARYYKFLEKRKHGQSEITRNMLVLAAMDTFFKQFSLSCVFLSISGCCLTLNALLVKELILYVSRSGTLKAYPEGKGVGLAIGIALLTATSSLFNNHFMYRAMLTGAQLRAVLTKIIFDKTCRLSSRGRHDYPLGTITSIIGADISRIDFALGYQPYFLTFIVPTALAIALLIVNIGVSAIIGVAVLFLFLVFIGISTRKLGALRRSVSVFTDARINYIKEVLYNLKIIKYYSWEIPYVANIKKVRDQEMKLVLTFQSIRNGFTALALTLNSIPYMVAFLVLYAIDSGRRSPASIFSSISLFNTLNQSIIYLPLAIPATTDCLIAFDRIAKFLNASESEVRDETKKHHSEYALEVKNAYFEWENFDQDEENNFDGDGITNMLLEKSKSSPFGLYDVNLKVRKGEFVAVTGAIGSGKSSLLQAIAGFMKKKSGIVEVYDSLLFCGSHWIQNATIKDNILFGSPFDKELYQQVLRVCCLEEDLNSFAAGDSTEVGERGITLSGGQKARLSLARAIYKQMDIILLDDVLSAVDSKVGKRIVKECLTGFLERKTRILATHQLNLVKTADRIIYLDKDGSMLQGTYEELLKDSRFTKLMAYGDSSGFVNSEVEKIDVEDLEEVNAAETQPEKVSDGKIVKEEEKAVNGIKFEVYKQYLRTGAGIFRLYGIIPLILTVVITSTFCSIFTNTWLSFWTANKFPQLSQGQYIGIYVMFTFLGVVLLCLEFSLVAYIATNASRILNVLAIQKIVRVPMWYMDTTPMGRILNRFTKDTDVLDNEFGIQMRLAIYSTASMIGIIILCICYLPWFAIAVPFLLIIFISIANFYLGAAREVKRLDATKRSFVFSNFNETLQGMDVIKAFKVDDLFVDRNSKLIDSMNEAYFLTVANQRWLGLHMDMMAAVFILIICLLCATGTFSISASSSGLVISYVLQIANQLTVLLRSYTNLENEMNSVERISQYAFNLPQEAPAIISEAVPKSSWPSKGAIEFENVSMRYRPELPYVLKDISISFPAGSKIGICGRTGAGKSSILTAIYRISELDVGKINIDGIDISQIGLTNLRSGLSIIPQDPVLFYGSIRKNLDPFGTRNDEDLWEALRRAGLIDKTDLKAIKEGDLQSHKFHLDQIVEDNGSNFSLGEKQLLALARALIRDTNILILDEATSSVDYKTDATIQATIRDEFENCTVLSIAHRLKTIINYDKILVLNDGSIAEFDSPWQLFSREDSIFRDMCIKSQISETDFKL
ncbi:oligomycin resistance ATP-dependent permease Yor1p [[Candida] anglica]|uniref:Oligomycin resistance ATP-dependent permease Yor1p n=1 Tax=[Candida] anglica TaxID=148631 RepID=A0ABP0EL14_9ASCO